ncbi:MAG: single-stranded-DNA-specific exonuclease RecJ [Clostridia bacterium]|nr:single-stranded-DNA-specific exonuclease RecJ [Clostridia bacterium]
MNTKWNLKSDYTLSSDAVRSLAEALKISPVTALLLCQRGYTDAEAAKRFMSPVVGEFHSPFLIPDMEKAVKRLEDAIQSGEKTVIYGDYDVDGVTSVSVLWLYLKNRGLSVDYYIPDRSGEGYGMNNAAIDKFHENGVKLMVTVDTGVTAIDEVAYAASLGIDTLVTDHHECQQSLPDAVAVVNPRRSDSDYPFKELAGVGVVFKLLSACETRRAANEEEARANIEKLCDSYIDLVAMGTVADVMPLVDENRLLVSRGLALMNSRPRMGLSALLGAASGGEKKPGAVTATTVSFVVAPRINAAGRIDSAERAVGLFLSSSPAETEAIAYELCDINRARQAEENRIIEEAEAKIAAECDFDRDSIIVLADDHWHHGVIGIVASRITEKYGLPSILISFDGDIGKGSGRSVKGINLVEALTDSKEYLVKFGGHELAAGLSVERSRIDAFRENINRYVKEHLTDADCLAAIDVDCEINATDVTLSLAEELSLLEPYGIANPSPLFMMRGVTLRGVMPLGEKHARFLLEKDGVSLSALRFGKSRRDFELYGGDLVDLVFQMNVNEFRGVRSAQMIVKDIRLGEGQYTVNPEDRRRYEALMNGAPFDKDEDILPTRDDIAPVYLWFKRHFGNTKDEITGVRELLSQFRSYARIHYVKLRVILKILDECGIVAIEYFGETGENIRYTVNYVKNKVDTEKAPTYSKLKQQMKK